MDSSSSPRGWDPYHDPVVNPRNSSNLKDTVFCQYFGGLFVWMGYLLVCVLLFYMIVLEWVVGLHARDNNVPCDVPLSDFLLACGAIGTLLLFLQAVHWAYKGCFRGHPKSPTKLGYGVCCLAFFTVIALSAGFIVLLAGNYWVWTSTTCQTTSAPYVPEPKRLMLPLWEASRMVVISANCILAFLVFLWVIFLCCVHYSDPSPNWAVSSRRSFLRDASLEYIITPAGLCYWMTMYRSSSSEGSYRPVRGHEV